MRPVAVVILPILACAPASAHILVNEVGMRIQTMSGTGGEFGQSFLAPGAELLTLGVQFATLNPTLPQNSVTIRLREGAGLGGPILGSLTVLPENQPRTGPFVFSDFDFSGITLVPGAPYTITLVNNGSGGRNGIVFGPNLVNPPFLPFGPDPYPDGRLFFAFGFNPCGTVSAPDCDLNFRVVTAEMRAVIPEPASWAMLILGFGLVGSALRRRAASAV